VNARSAAGAGILHLAENQKSASGARGMTGRRRKMSENSNDSILLQKESLDRVFDIIDEMQGDIIGLESKWLKEVQEDDREQQSD